MVFSSCSIFRRSEFIWFLKSCSSSSFLAWASFRFRVKLSATSRVIIKIRSDKLPIYYWPFPNNLFCSLWFWASSSRSWRSVLSIFIRLHVSVWLYTDNLSISFSVLNLANWFSIGFNSAFSLVQNYSRRVNLVGPTYANKIFNADKKFHFFILFIVFTISFFPFFPPFDFFFFGGIFYDAKDARFWLDEKRKGKNYPKLRKNARSSKRSWLTRLYRETKEKIHYNFIFLLKTALWTVPSRLIQSSKLRLIFIGISRTYGQK